MKKMLKLKAVAFFLAMATLLSIICVPVSAEDAIAEEPLSENTVSELEPIETEDQIFERLTANSLMLNYIDETAFRAAGHVNRLLEEEDLNTYVFENADGTRTAYILAEPVKYVDSTGEIREKNLTLSIGQIGNASVMANGVNTGAYTVTATNTPMTFPNDLSQGVRFTYGEYTVTLRPETVSTATTIMQADGKVLYRNAFGATAHLMYTPQLNGLKEDIVLTRYTDQNTFSFILDTDGLIPASDAGGYYLWDGIDPKMKIRLGQVVSYDANGDFSIGEMTVEQISGTSYRVTLTVNEDFLQNAFYPVTVDPTLTVNSANAVEEITVFTNRTDIWLNGQATYIGYYNEAYGYARAIVRANGLDNSQIYQGLPLSSLISCTLHFHNADPSVAGVPIIVYRNKTSNWAESSTPTGSIDIDFSEIISNCTMAGGYNWSGVDITDFVENWKNDTWSIDEGLAMVISQEGTNTRLGGFYTSEHSSLRPYLTLQYNSWMEIETEGNDYVEIGGEHQLTTFIWPPVNNIVQWHSADTSIATVNDEGVVTGISEGCVRIYAAVRSIEGATKTAYHDLYVVPILPGTYYLGNIHNSRYADLELDPNNLFPPSKEVYQWEFAGTYAQKWIFSYQKTAGAYTIRSDQDTAYYLTADASGNINVSPGAVNASRLWEIENGERGRKIISCNTGTVLATPTTAQTNGNYLVCTTYTANTDYKDEWSITKIPTSGYEVAYQPELWNDGNSEEGEELTHQETTNCYAYALNTQEIYAVYPMQPGVSTHYSSVEKINYDFVYLYFTGEYHVITVSTDHLTQDGDVIYNRVLLDSDYFGFEFTPISRDAICDESCYKVALVIDHVNDDNISDETFLVDENGNLVLVEGCPVKLISPDLDYHWYRQNPDGTWSHKPGQDVVTNLDASGKIIYDPETANRDYVEYNDEYNVYEGVNYSAFIGYYQVTPIGNIGVR